ncbi:ABC transporter permease [Aneurinibacillus aneurinilyticus]|uniref:ABC transporter permease n=2 Tax=Aneurinibacillus aneurinilyticus TaxID=1391 RepID=A0A848CVL6_ANEAE|nr:ABC transporter permease [Aneurinibacillus aneurinilyticus]NME97386.1 ABC transporter permease [Aneurinibacillus aneurinilyticus]
MTLFSIAKKNMKMNFRHYFLYFASMIFSIVIYFTFVSLKYDQTIQATSDGSTKISSAFSGAAVVLIIFVAIFIWYSNSFFTRKRKKEVGLYSLLGVRKKQIGQMLFYENLIMGLLALIIGIAIGSVLSKLFVALLMKLMGYEAVGNFSISIAAIINTVIVFSLITLIASFQGYRLIYRFKLIELFQAEKEGEKESSASFLIALLSIILIGSGYWIALQNLMDSKVWRTLGLMVTPMVILVTVVLGTYFLFSTLTVYLLKLSRKNKKSYWKGINIIGTSQLLYRMKGNARTLTVIAVLSATTLTAVCTAYSMYYNNRTNAEKFNPNSFMFIDTNNHVSQKVQSIVNKSKNHQVIYHETIPTLEMKADITGFKNEFYGNELMYTVISNHDFNKLAKEQKHNENLTLKGNEAVVLDATYMDSISPAYVGSAISFKTNKKVQHITVTDFKKYSVFNLYTAQNSIVISDELFARLQSEIKPLNIEAYKITDDDDAKQLSKDIQAIVPEKANLSSFYANYATGLESSGLMIFMGGFLGLVFLAATGSIIYFKQLTEAGADKDRYEILHKIGVKKKEIRKSIAKQILFIFALPLLAGITHCAVALTALSNLMQTNLVVPVVICMGIYTIAYIVYYFLTVHSYYKIVIKTK